MINVMVMLGRHGESEDQGSGVARVGQTHYKLTEVNLSTLLSSHKVDDVLRGFLIFRKIIV